MAHRKLADTVHLRLRYPEKLRRRIEAAAVKNQQSMNAEIVERLERSFAQEDSDASLNTAIHAAADAAVTQAIERYKARAERLAATVAGRPLFYAGDQPGVLRKADPYRPDEVPEPLPGQIQGLQFVDEEPGEKRAEPSEKPEPEEQVLTGPQAVGADLMGADAPAQPRRSLTKP
jgi:hypothetical protein